MSEAGIESRILRGLGDEEEASFASFCNFNLRSRVLAFVTISGRWRSISVSASLTFFKASAVVVI